MKIIETTPPPVERTFTIELTENQLKNLGLAMGTIIPNAMKKLINDKTWQAKVFPGIVYEDPHLYDKIVDVFKANK